MSLNEWMAKLDEALEKDCTINNYLDVVQKKTNVKKRYIALVIILLVSGWLVYGYAADLLCNLIGFVYPAYISVKAIESANKDDDTEWLIYWVVFSVFSVIEFFSDILLSWFPFYYLGKCIFLLWCMSPVPWNGSTVIYKRIIRPFVLRHESKIDSTIDKARKKASHVTGGLIKEVASGEVAKVIESALEDPKKSD